MGIALNENYYKDSVNHQWEFLLEYELFTQQELELVTCINGYSIETLNDMIYARYGFHDIFQLAGNM